MTVPAPAPAGRSRQRLEPPGPSTNGEPVKSAYERALEKLESRGIAAPQQEALGEGQRRQIEDARGRHQAKVAELEILHRKNLAADPAKRLEEEENYRTELQRLAERLESDIESIRRG